MFITTYYSIALGIFVFALVFAWGVVSKLRKTSATYNARLLPFASYSLSSWALWTLQYTILLATLFPATKTELYVSIGLSLGMLQNALWASAVLSLSPQKFSRIWVTLPVLIAFLIAFRTPVITSAQFTQIDAALAAVIFASLAYLILQWRQRKILAAVFFIHAMSSWIWRTLWFMPPGETRFALLLAFPIWHLALLVAWITSISGIVREAQAPYKEIIKDIQEYKGVNKDTEGQTAPNPFATIEVMISSTVDDLVHERAAVERAISALRLNTLRSETLGSLSHSPKAICELLAERCDIFVLIIGERYGYVFEPENISVVEFEYRTARAQNPHKILVYVKDIVFREPRLEEFLAEIQGFTEGYFRTLFTTPEDLYQKIQGDITRWLTSQVKP